MKENKKIYLEFLRIFAIFLVIFNHIRGYTLYQESNELLKTWFYMFITMFTRINVPIFLMISGSLLLGKNESFKDLFKKRILRIILVIIFIGTLTYMLDWNKESSFKDLIFKLISGSIEGSHWYLYAYLGMLIMKPFLSKIAINFNKEYFYYILLIHFFTSSLIPILGYILGFGKTGWISIYFSLPLATEKAIFYPLIGYYLDKILDINKINSKKIFSMILLSILGILISSYFTYHQGINNWFTQDFVELFDYITAITIFITIKYLFTNKGLFENNIHINSLINKLGPLTLGIYLFDPILRKLLYSNFELLLEPILPTLIVSLLWCLSSIIICSLITYIIKKLPVLRYLF